MILTSPLYDPIGSDATLDGFLGGRLQIEQPKRGYRAGIDPVLLAASVCAVPGQSVLELGCGVGVASLCLAYRVKGLSITGIERIDALVELAKKNAHRNALDLSFEAADLQDLPQEIRQQQYDHVIANPPYFLRSEGSVSEQMLRESARGEETELAKWLEIAAKRVKPKGYVHFIHRTQRLPTLFAALPKSLGSITILPLAARQNRPSELMILRARNGGRSPFRLLPPLIMQCGAIHETDASDYSETIRAVLEDGAALKALS